MNTTPEFTLTRRLPAAPQEVWRAWTTPELMAKWHFPEQVHTPLESISVDARVGGNYAYTMIEDASGKEWPTVGQFLEVDEPRRLVYTWAAPDTPDGQAPVITVELAPASGGAETDIRLTVRGIEGEPGDDDVYDGWSEVLIHLDAFVAL